MNPEQAQQNDFPTLHYINRDHVIVASIRSDEVIITTSLGRCISVTGPPHQLAYLIDELVNGYGSNFVRFP